MKAPLPPRALFLLLVLSFACSFSAFFLGYHQDSARVSSLGQLAWAHLSYAEELKDDMGVIDWSKNLEKLDAVRAFQVVLGSKVLAEGGNRNSLPTQAAPGVAYLFPSDWSFQRTASQGSLAPMEFTLLLHLGPGPFLWGLFAFFLSWVIGYGTALGVSPAAMPSKVPTAYEPHSPTPVLQPFQHRGTSPGLSDQKGAVLFIDKNYVIQQASHEAAAQLQKNAKGLLGGHLLDLTPDPVLIQAFERGVETKILKPFPDNPDISATLKPQAEGYLLVLESLRPPQKP